MPCGCNLRDVGPGPDVPSPALIVTRKTFSAIAMRMPESISSKIWKPSSLYSSKGFF